MNTRTRWIPRLIITVAILHLAVGFLGAASTWSDIAAAGFVDALGDDVARNEAFWFVMSGFAWLALGEFARWAVRETGRLPARLGGWLLGIGVATAVLMPASGGWVVAAIGAFALRVARGESGHATLAAAPVRTATHT